MDVDAYFKELTDYFSKAYHVASKARGRGYDPETFVEIKPAPDFASRVEGIIGIDGLAAMIRLKAIKSRQELAFAMVGEICTNPRFESVIEKRLTLAVRVGLAVLTEGVLVAPTEGFQGVKLHKNPDGSTYVALIYAGPIRGAGGTSAALSVALADYGRRILGISDYKAQKSEIERCVEEIMLYHTRAARLQYLPKEDDLRVILENCPVCIDGLPTEQIEVSVHRNIVRLDASGAQETMTNRVRGGMPLVVCEGIAQKAKSVLKHTKTVGLDWLWLNNIIKADKLDKSAQKAGKDVSVFLQELVAGRPVLAYPNFPGAFRLRYGRSRLTGIAAKGFSPATMIVLDNFIACGTQLKVEKPGKGCIAMPVDSIEGPFVKLDDGTAMRINTAEEARKYSDRIRKILAVGDILVTFGDFKKTNTPLAPSSYVEEYWYEQLRTAGYGGEMPALLGFTEALSYSRDFNVPMHPRYIYDYNELSNQELKELASSIAKLGISGDLSSVEELRFTERKDAIASMFERLCIPHLERDDSVTVEGDEARSLVATLGFIKGGKIDIDERMLTAFDAAAKPTDILSGMAGFTVMQRSTRIGARIGRPEKARERQMRPPPNVLFPVGEYGGKERSLTKAYAADKKRFGGPRMEVDLARYRCSVGNELLASQYCARHGARARVERVCPKCGGVTLSETCEKCSSPTVQHGQATVDLASMVEGAAKRLGLEGQLPKLIKGVKGMMSDTKDVEPIEKGILRSRHGIHIFKDGTARFDATDVPITHFYPCEIGTSVERLRQLGYTKDYMGNELTSDEQLVEMRHQDVILNVNEGDFILRMARFIDALLVRFYGLEKFYNAEKIEDIVGHCVITLAPHTSCAVLNRIIGFTGANIGLAHPYTITARRRNCDGDEDTTMLLLDALINFSRHYLPTTIGSTMDTPLILSTNVKPEEVDDEVWEMDVVQSYGKEFYDKTMQGVAPSDAQVERVGSRLNSKEIYDNLLFTHKSGPSAIADSPKQCTYVKLKTMHEKIEEQFALMDRLYTVDRADTARRLILSHFIPDLIGNLHSFSRQTFRCIQCNAKYTRVPLSGKCRRCGGKLVLTISKGGIEKYLTTAINLADRYGLEVYIKQRLMLVKDEISNIFGEQQGLPTKQFDLTKFM